MNETCWNQTATCHVILFELKLKSVHTSIWCHACPRIWSVLSSLSTHGDGNTELCIEHKTMSNSLVRNSEIARAKIIVLNTFGSGYDYYMQQSPIILGGSPYGSGKFQGGRLLFLPGALSYCWLAQSEGFLNCTKSTGAKLPVFFVFLWMSAFRQKSSRATDFGRHNPECCRGKGDWALFPIKLFWKLQNMDCHGSAGVKLPAQPMACPHHCFPQM